MRTSVMLAPLVASLMVMLVALAHCDPREARQRNSWWSKKSVLAAHPPPDLGASRRPTKEAASLTLPSEEGPTHPTEDAAIGPAYPYDPLLPSGPQGPEDLPPHRGVDGDDGFNMSLDGFLSPYSSSCCRGPPSRSSSPALLAALAALTRLPAPHRPQAQAILLSRLQSLASEYPHSIRNLHINSDSTLTRTNTLSQ